MRHTSIMNLLKVFTISIILYSGIYAKSVMDNDDLHDKTREEFHSDDDDRDALEPNVSSEERIRNIIAKSQKIVQQHKPAKNVILFVGDGMGISTLTAARRYLAQSRNLLEHEALLSWERLPYASLSKVQSTDNQIPDSAATATALLCGEKTKNDYIAVQRSATYDNCTDLSENKLISILHHAINEGKRTGIVTTARITHATPACAYAHAPNRDWESDADLPDDYDGTEACSDIAAQLIDNPINQQINVLLGGGRRNFIPRSMVDYEYSNKRGDRKDERDLIKEWLDEKDNRVGNYSKYAFVYNQTSLEDINSQEIEYLLGLFEPSHMKFESDRVDLEDNTEVDPSLVDMVDRAIRILEKGENGYFLLVESGRIDHAHHRNNAKRALEETVVFSDTVQRAIDLTNEDETLLVVTADHSHVFTISGYASPNTNILQYDPDAQIGDDGKPFSILGYTNGPGYYLHRTKNGSLSSGTSRLDLTHLSSVMDHKNFLQDSGIPRKSETHSGEDVAVFTSGPMSHLFTGIQEQSNLGQLMMFALCVGDNKDLCLDENLQNPFSVGSGSSVLTVSSLFIMLLACLLTTVFLIV